MACFITLEGIDGAGKTSHLPAIAALLAEHGIDALLTREPGGTPLGERLRALLLDPATQATLDTETLLMFAARCEHVQTVIRPALASGRWVLSDRFTDATFAFQGGGRGVDSARIATLEDWVQQGLQPDLTLLFDAPTEVAHARMAGERQLDRFEQEAAAFHQRVRAAYLARAAADPTRIVLIRADQPLAQVRADALAAVAALLAAQGAYA